jgi:hypothetical protein
VVVALVAHEGQRGDPCRPAVAGVVGHGWPWQQGSEVALQPLADAQGMAAEPIRQTVEAVPLEPGIEGSKAGSARDWDQEVAPGVTDQALDLALVVAFAGPAEAVEEQVARPQLGEGPGPLPLAAAQDPGHRQPGVVVEDRARRPTQQGKGRVVPVEEGLDPLGRVGLDEAGVRVRQVEAEEVDLATLAADHRHCFAEVDLRMARRVHERDEHLPHPLPPLADVVLHDRVATGEAMLGSEALVDPPGRVPLLGR